CTVITGLENLAQLKPANDYVRDALALYPDNGEIQLLAGVGDELLGSPRTSALTDSDRQRALHDAEQHFRAALAAQPDRMEARLRLGHVLQQRNGFTEARTTLQPLVDVSDGRIAYLALLFLGGVEDGDGHADAALAAYDRAAALLPTGQAARLAA